MFALDEWLKPKVLFYLEESSNMRFLLDHYWDNLVLYLLVSPLQWLHMMHLLYGSAWEHYGILSKGLLMLYSIGVLAQWELLRIVIFYACRSVQEGTVTETANNVVTAAAVLGQQGLEHAGPLMARIAESATDLSKKGFEKAKPMVDQAFESAADMANRGLERAKPMVNAISESATNLAARVKQTTEQVINKVRPPAKDAQSSGVEEPKTSLFSDASNKSN